MADYLIMSDLNARIPGPYLVQALDDDGDGVADAGAFDAIRTAVQTEIDGILGARFTVPFSNPVPAIVLNAAQIMACELVYQRRGVEDAKNPWSKLAKGLRDQLRKIADGKASLTPETEKAKAKVSVVTEPAKTTSATGKLPV